MTFNSLTYWITIMVTSMVVGFIIEDDCVEVMAKQDDLLIQYGFN